MSTEIALAASVALLAVNGFFVAAEFALVASKAHRLEDEADAGNRASRAAALLTRQLSMSLAGAQLGITLCSLGLGALAEPAIAHSLSPIFHDLGLGDDLSHVIAFVLALTIVVFLHMVVGEMAPKSWAITHPERSARYLALPFALFTTLAKPLLYFLNATTNRFLRLFHIEPTNDLASAHGPEELRFLLEQSKQHGTLPDPEHQLLSRMLRLQRRTVGDVMIARPHVVTVTSSTIDAAIESKAAQAGRSRLAVVDEAGTIVGLVHIRDAIRSTTRGMDQTADDLSTEPHVLGRDLTISQAVEAMRAHRSQLAVVNASEGQVGVVALEDLLEELLGEFDDETDPANVVARRSKSRQSGA